MERVQMSTRSGSFVTLRELRDEVGNDAARFFYVMRKCEQHLDFDLELAKSKSNENPVYYIQYAHARICSVLRQQHEKGLVWEQPTDFTCLDNSHEKTLLAHLITYPEVVETAAMNREPHIIAHYLRELASHFHGYYNAHAFLVDEKTLRNARLSLIIATRHVFAHGLKLLGVSAPETM
jgi:arginyl-tRNA synthetase